MTRKFLESRMRGNLHVRFGGRLFVASSLFFLRITNGAGNRPNLLNTILLLSSGVCHKCEISDLIGSFCMASTLPFSNPRINPLYRIGPHNIDILSLLVGSLLGDGSMEKSVNGSRFVYYQAKVNGEYLLWLHSFISKLGYAHPEIPQIYSRPLVKSDEIRYYYRFRTFTFSSFD